MKDMRVGVFEAALMMHVHCGFAGVFERLGDIIWKGVAALTRQDHSKVYLVTREQSSL